MTGIAEMFAALDGRDRYEYQLTIWAVLAAAARAEHVKAWKASNPIRARRSHAQREARWRAGRPPEQCYRCTEPHVPGKRACATHLEFDRKRAAAKYAAKKARLAALAA